MCKFLIFIISFSLLYSNIQAQSRNYKTWVYLMDSGIVYEGYLESVEDSLLNLFSYDESNKPGHIVNQISVHEIKMLNFRKKGKLVSGIALGSLIGAFVAAGISQGVPFKDSGNKGLLIIYPLVGGVLGGVVGAGIGSVKIKIPINANLKEWESKKDKIKKYL